MKIAVVGAGVAGLGAAYLLSRAHEVDVFEREPRLGGHAHTHDVDHGGDRLAIDTGFLVYNTRTYPAFTRLLDELQVASRPSDMSFSVRCRRCALQYGSRSLRALFAQRARLLDPFHWRLLLGIVRFFGAGRRFLAGTAAADVTLGQFLEASALRDDVARHFILPMTGAIWSASSTDMEAFPARTILQFLDNHGLLAPVGAPRWRTIAGGSRLYVQALAARVSGRVRAGEVVTSIERREPGVRVGLASGEAAVYDKVVVAMHADEALSLLIDASPEERALLGRFRYAVNDTVLHTDESVLPRQRSARASWNCDLTDCRQPGSAVSLTYHLNRLQGIPGDRQYCVTLNGAGPPRGRVLARMVYTHPILDRDAVSAQPELAALSGTRDTYFCGAYLRYGFHEDGFQSAVQAAARLGVTW